MVREAGCNCHQCNISILHELLCLALWCFLCIVFSMYCWFKDMLKTNQTIHYHTVSVMFCIIIKSQQFPAYFQIFDNVNFLYTLQKWFVLFLNLLINISNIKMVCLFFVVGPVKIFGKRKTIQINVSWHNIQWWPKWLEHKYFHQIKNGFKSIICIFCCSVSVEISVFNEY